MYWDYSRGGGYSPVDADGQEVAASRRDRPPVPRSGVAGDTVDYAYDDATGALTVRWHPTRRSRRRRDRLPPRFGSVDVACGGCAVTVTATGVELSGSAATRRPRGDALGVSLKNLYMHR